MQRGNDWSARVTREVGRQIAYHRKRAHVTASALGARCAELGRPLDRAVIAKLETGHRNSVTVDEVYILARALDVCPLSLLFAAPPDDDALVEVLPGRRVPAREASWWYSGLRRLPETPCSNCGDQPPKSFTCNWCGMGALA
jgi:hypothetical protein